MDKKVQEVQYFFYSQAFADGSRATFAILLPALAGLYLDHFETGLTVSLGAMATSLTDSPGPFIHKRNGMLFAALFIYLTALITAFTRLNVYTLAIEIGVASFFFSMFNVYGARATGVGNSAIVIMILTMDNAAASEAPFLHSLLILGGSLFYIVLSLLLYKIRPYRIAQRALGDCIRQMATYLSIKADFYDPSTELTSDYSKMVSQQIVVHEKQDAVRELLFKTRETISESTTMGRKLVFTFVETVDLFESITATYYDYAMLRQQYADTGVLEKMAASLKRSANELDNIGIAIQSNTAFTRSFDYDSEIVSLKEEINSLEQRGSQAQVLKKILVNIRTLLNHFNIITRYFNDVDVRTKRTDHSHFISHQSLHPKILLDNLSFRSSAFKHSLRVSLACLAGFMVANIISYGHHSYWILLTIAFILKPAFSLTKQRNIQRIIGTLAGGAIGVLILIFIPNKIVQFILMVLFMLGTYSFMRIKYLVMVVCTTPYVLILFNLLGGGFIHVAGERLLDTVIACTIAIPFSYFLFPSWEAHQLHSYMLHMLRANKQYLKIIVDALSGKLADQIKYKLSRKEVYVASANLSAAFQRMISEPKSKQANKKQLHQFVVLNHILFSNIASVATSLLSQKEKTYSRQLSVTSKIALEKLNKALEKFNGSPVNEATHSSSYSAENILTQDEQLLKEQLDFISTIADDIEKITGKIILEGTF